MKLAEYQFPYEPAKYVAGLMLSILISVMISLVGFAAHGEPIFALKIEQVIKCTMIVLIPVLVLGSLVKYYWIPMLVYLVIETGWSLFVILVLIPKPVDATASQMLLRSWDTLIGPIFACGLPATFFQQYCKWVCCLPENKPGG